MFSSFFQPMPDVSARSCLMYHSCFQFYCMMYHITKQSFRKSHPKISFFWGLRFYFLTYLLNNISTRDINRFKSSYIYSAMPVLDWRIIPYWKTCFIFTNQLLAPNNLFFKQSVCICKQTNVSQFIVHTCARSYLHWKSQTIAENTITP